MTMTFNCFNLPHLISSGLDVSLTIKSYLLILIENKVHTIIVVKCRTIELYYMHSDMDLLGRKMDFYNESNLGLYYGSEYDGIYNFEWKPNISRYCIN